MKWNVFKKENAVILEMNSNKANVHNPDFFADFHEAMDCADKDAPGSPLILTAQGPIFSAGIDFQYCFGLFQKGNQSAISDWFRDYSRVMMRLFESPRMTIAALNGHTFAGGMILALCCDFRIAAQGNSQFSINEVPVGVPMPSVYTEIIRFRLGNPPAQETILSGEIYDAEAAVRHGLVKKTVPAGDLMKEALKQANCIAPPCYAAYRHSKKMLQYPTLQFVKNQSAILETETIQQIGSPDSIKAQTMAFENLGKKKTKTA